MFLQLLEGLGADVMFHPAGILGGLGFADPQLYKPAGKELVALIDARGDLEALFGQFQCAIGAHGQLLIFPQQLHRPADAGLGKIEMPGHVDRVDDALLLFQYQNGLQIVLGGFLYPHMTAPFLLFSLSQKGGKGKPLQSPRSCESGGESAQDHPEGGWEGGGQGGPFPASRLLMDGKQGGGTFLDHLEDMHLYELFIKLFFSYKVRVRLKKCRDEIASQQFLDALLLKIPWKK